MKTVILGVTGSIAAYKSLELTRFLVKRNIKVIPILTPEAKNFVTPLSFECLASQKAYYDFFQESENIIHISIMKKADVIAIIPATANFIGKLAGGIVDNLLLGIVFASNKPVLIAPAMNEGMWKNPILTQNVQKLKKLGYHFVGPAKGSLACKDEGIGRLEDTDVILEEVLCLLEDKKTLKNKKILITLGRTKEYLDPVRYISNDASGRFGLEIAKAARRRGAEVSIIAGYKDVKIPALFHLKNVSNTEEMADEVMKIFNSIDILIMNAACSDFTPQKLEKDKIKKEKRSIKVPLKRTKDILSLIKRRKDKQIVVGFSVDTKDAIKSAKKKMKEKDIDIMIVNPFTTAGSIAVEMTILLNKGKSSSFPKMNKSEAAKKIIDIISKRLKKYRYYSNEH